MNATRVTAEEVKHRMDRGEPILFVDVRNPKAWDAAGEKLPGARRGSVDDVDRLARELPRDRTLVTYCT